MNKRIRIGLAPPRAVLTGLASALREVLISATPTLALLVCAAAQADALHPHEDDAVDDLVRAAQNPVATMISLPFQNNMQRLENGATLNSLLIQPVIPFRINEDWNLVTRTILPVIGLSAPPNGVQRWALGDIQQSYFFSPNQFSNASQVWGAGPVVSFPTASSTAYGSGKWGLGPSFVGVQFSGPWVFGGLLNNIWSVAGDSDRKTVSQMSFQPFINYNYSDGWFLQSAPLITADWKASGGNKWTVPVGGGGGRTFRIGTQPVTTILTAFYNVERPDGGPKWNVRFQMTFMFPR